MAVWMAVAVLWLMDASINVSMEPFRAFVGDKLDTSQQTAGFAMQTFLIGCGAVIASLLPIVFTDSLGVSNVPVNGAVPDSVRYSFYIGGAAFLLAVTWTVFTSTELPPPDLDRFAAQRKHSRNFGVALREILEGKVAPGVLDTVLQHRPPPAHVAHAVAYRELIGRGHRFLTFAGGGATIGYRMREDPRERPALRLVRETDGGLVIAGKIGMHTSPAYAEDVYIGAINGAELDGHRATFVVAVNAPGVTVICRRPAAREAEATSAPLSSRFDELDGQMWLEDVLVPWERVFLTEASPDPVE